MNTFEKTPLVELDNDFVRMRPFSFELSLVGATGVDISLNESARRDPGVMCGVDSTAPLSTKGLN